MRGKLFSPIFLLFAVLVALLGCSESAPPPEDPPPPPEDPAVTNPFVYFVGNSLTYVNGIPKKFDTLMEENNRYPEGEKGYIQTQGLKP